MSLAFKTENGASYHSTAEEYLRSHAAKQHKGNVDLIFTSPPFPLNRKKKYGNLKGQEYIDWLAEFAPLFRDYLAPTGSIVMEVGNSWVPGQPAMSTLALEAMLAFLKAGNFVLCQQFIWNNPARLPGPVQWVNVERIRVKDAFTHLWWMSTSDRPKADNRRVLAEYSRSMQELLASQTYNAGQRPSEHRIGRSSFLTDNGGAIPSNVISVPNTHSADEYMKYCRDRALVLHPARMPTKLAEFFIKLLTDPDDLVLDPFAGSNTTGAAAEGLGRRWIALEPNVAYIQGSVGRFPRLRFIRPTFKLRPTSSGPSDPHAVHAAEHPEDGQ